MITILIKGATVVNEGISAPMDVLIKDGKIESVAQPGSINEASEIVDGTGKYLIPGLIDDQVHFREPGLTHKADLTTESRAAVAGGITSFMEMPNTVPQSLTQQLLQDKYDRAAEVSVANYSFFMGASNQNLEEVLKTDARTVCGVKVFMGSSTGDMLVDDKTVLEGIFSECPSLIATHCEDEATVRANAKHYFDQYGDYIPIHLHPVIRSVEACYKSSSMAVELATKYNSRLHILHISSGKEVNLFRNDIPLLEKRITSEACVHHLWFCDEDYKKKGTFIKWNPAVKTADDRAEILRGVLDNRIDVIATDHAPHTLAEKQNPYTKAPSGGPLVQHVLVALLEMHHQGKISLEKIVEKTSHAVAECFQIEKRGYIREGYWADLVLVDLENPWMVEDNNILYKCGWSPFLGQTFKSKVISTWVNGNRVYNDGQLNESTRGQRILFER